MLYAAAGPMTQMGGGDGILRTYVYNTRIQPTSITATLGTTTLLNLGLNFPTSANNGNLPSETITRPGFSATQSFGYDFKNRLTSATEGSNWTQNYKFDLEGNMAMGAGSAVIASSLTPQTNNTTTVPFNNANQWSGATYTDGNMTFLAGQTLAYDAEQRMRQWSTTGPPASTVTFGYDGDGKRTTKVKGSQSTVFVYDAFGSLAAEYGGPAPSIVGTLYMTRDHLGSTRMVTNSSGVVVGCHDYLPFGEEVPQSWGRSAVSCYGQMGEVVDKFTGQIRDSETGYDYFGARYFGGAQGRWTSPDSINITDERLVNPSNTLNKYIYGANNPLKYKDPDGRDITLFYTETGNAGHFWLAAYDQGNGQSAILDFGPANGVSQTQMALGRDVPGNTDYASHMTSANDLRRDYTSLTIQTNPEDTQKAISAIKSTNAAQPAYNVYGADCTTVCRDILHTILGLDTNSIRPSALWSDVYIRWSKAAQQPRQTTSRGRPAAQVQSTHGVDFGDRDTE